MNTRRMTVRILASLTLVLFSAGAMADLPFAQPGPDAAMVTGTPGRPANDIYPVNFVEIDGQNIVNRNTFWLKPGKYTIRVQPIISNTVGLSVQRSRLRSQDTDLNLIELVVEPGKSYYIGARVDRTNRREPYTTVLYRVEDQE